MAKAARPLKENPRINYKPKNETQKRIKDEWDNYQYMVFQGPGGSGKTSAAFYHALMDKFQGKTNKKIWLCRPNEPLGKDIGFLPGDVEVKMRSWMGSFSSVLDFFGEDLTLEKMANHVEFIPLCFVQGVTIQDRTMIVDEAQNLKIDEICTLVERIGNNGKLILCGDPKRVSSKHSAKIDENTPLVFHTKKMAEHKVKGFNCFVFQPQETLRSEFCKTVVSINNQILEQYNS